MSSGSGATFELVAIAPGSHELGAVAVSVGGRVYETEPLTLVVSDEHGAIEVRAALNTERAWVGGEFVLLVEATGVRELEEDPGAARTVGSSRSFFPADRPATASATGSITARASYRFRALQPGDFEIGPIAVTAADRTVLTEPVHLDHHRDAPGSHRA